MIVVRDIFHYKYGQDDVPSRFKDLADIIRQSELSKNEPRLLLDFSGEFNTLTLETTHSSLADYESSLAELMKNPSFIQWYDDTKVFISGGKREVLQIID